MFRTKVKKILFLLFFIYIFSNPLLWSLEVTVPLPDDAIQILEKNVNIGPSQSSIKSYSTSLSEKKIKSFFDKEMVKAGWRKEQNNIFMKEDYFTIIAVVSGAKDNKMRFVVTTSRVPKKEEILALRKTVPDKVNFMPIFPGSTQNFFWDLPVGASASYETEKSIKEVVFFYKSAMLNYGWSLYNEIPVKTEEINCPECKKAMDKLPAGSPKFDMKGSSNKAVLAFRRGNGENCKIEIYQNIFDLQGDTGIADIGKGLPNKTTILVTYYANKRINP
jgi:hypothetical protein